MRGRTLAAFIAAALAITVAACGSDSPPSLSAGATTAPQACGVFGDGVKPVGEPTQDSDGEWEQGCSNDAEIDLEDSSVGWFVDDDSSKAAIAALGAAGLLKLKAHKAKHKTLAGRVKAAKARAAAAKKVKDAAKKARDKAGKATSGSKPSSNSKPAAKSSSGSSKRR